MIFLGYCYTTGVKVNGEWEFLKCDGRSSKCAQDGGVVPNVPPDKNYRCKDCGEYCETYDEAVRAIEDWEKIHNE